MVQHIHGVVSHVKGIDHDSLKLAAVREGNYLTVTQMKLNKTPKLTSVANLRTL